MPPDVSPGSPNPQSPGSSSRRHLATQHAELQRRYDTLTQRLAAVDTARRHNRLIERVNSA